MPAVSVILPFYNEEKNLNKAVESIVAQYFDDFELILINNNSTDESPGIARDLGKKDSRIVAIDEYRSGIVFALNTGIKKAKGKYIARMDADDIAKPHRLKRQFDYLENNPDTGLVACCVEYHTSMPNMGGMQHFVDWNNTLLSHDDIFLNRFIETPVVHPSVMFRKHLIDQYGGYENGDFPEDYQLWLRWLDKGVKFAKLPGILMEWHDHSKRLTRNDQRYSRQAFYITKTGYLIKYLEMHNPFHPEVVIFGAGRTARRRSRLLEKMGLQIKYYVDIEPATKEGVVYYRDIPEPGTSFILSYIAKRGARADVRDYLKSKKYNEGIDYLMIG
jgi:glycosyltransferase involved in cell wall biosynthesis